MYQNESVFGNEFGNELFEFNNEFNNEYNNEYHEFGNEFGNELHESLEMEFAHELLNVSNEQELNHFLGKMFKTIGKGLGSIAKPLGGVLKSVAKVGLPILGKVAGTAFGGPLGGMIGGKLGSMAGNLFELELEGLSPEDREFEVARAYVRFVNEATNNAAELRQRHPNVSPSQIAQQAIKQAAVTHAPGLIKNPATTGLPNNSNQSFKGFPASGTWRRVGRTITLY